jgi:hypothetical protein
MRRRARDDRDKDFIESEAEILYEDIVRWADGRLKEVERETEGRTVQYERGSEEIGFEFVPSKGYHVTMFIPDGEIFISGEAESYLERLIKTRTFNFEIAVALEYGRKVVDVIKEIMIEAGRALIAEEMDLDLKGRNYIEVTYRGVWAEFIGVDYESAELRLRDFFGYEIRHREFKGDKVAEDLEQILDDATLFKSISKEFYDLLKILMEKLEDLGFVVERLDSVLAQALAMWDKGMREIMEEAERRV